MSKKNLKRSLALSALMAFVITGSAMAAEKEFDDRFAFTTALKNGDVNVADDVTINNTDTGYYGAGITAGPVDVDVNSLTINSDRHGIFLYKGVNTIDVTGDLTINAGSGNSQGILLNKEGSNYVESLTIDAENIIIDAPSGYAYSNKTGPDTKVSIEASKDMTFEGAYGVSNAAGQALNLTAENISITATNKYGLYATAGGGVNVKATGDLNIETPVGQNAIQSHNGLINVDVDGNTVIEGNIHTSNALGEVKVNFNGQGSSLTGAVTGVGTSTLEMNDGATWNVTGDSNLSVLAGSGANINVGAGVTSIKIEDNQNDDVNLSKDASGGAVTKKDLEALKDIVDAGGKEIKVDATMTNAYLTGDVTLDEAGLMNTKIDTDRFVVSGSVRANGITSLKDVYAFDGKGKFNSLNETAAQAEANKQAIANVYTKDEIDEYRAKTEQEVNDKFGKVDQAIEDNKAAIDENKVAIENNDKAIKENRNDIEANREAIKDVQDVANKNAADIAVNKEAIKDLQDATNKNTADIAANKAGIEANKQAIADEVAAREAADKALSDAIDNVAGDIAGTKAQVEENKVAIADNAQAIENEVAAREAADKKLQASVDKESVDRQIADAQERAERAQADQELQANIDAEAQARQDADAKEAQIRSNEDQRIESKFDGEVGRLDNRIDKVDAKIDKVGAMAAAMASLKTMGYDPEAPTEIAVGVGQYRNETGLAIGAFHYPNKNFMLNFSLSTAGDEVMGGVGATWKIGRKKPAGETMEDKVAKAEAMKKAAKAARVKAQQARHAKMLAEKSK